MKQRTVRLVIDADELEHAAASAKTSVQSFVGMTMAEALAVELEPDAPYEVTLKVDGQTMTIKRTPGLEVDGGIAVEALESVVDELRLALDEARVGDPKAWRRVEGALGRIHETLGVTN